MKTRQLKKNLRKSIELLNRLEIVEYDIASEGVLYINVEDTSITRATINKVCSLQHLDRQNVFHDIRENQKEYSSDPVPHIDLILVYQHMRMPKNQDIAFQGKGGFSLVQIPDELRN